jgi:hypothetical protein
LITTNLEHCSHGFRKDGWLPCTFCKPDEAQALQGKPSAFASQAEPPPRRNTASLGIQQPSRVLDLSGKTIAGCAVGKMAVNATANTRFHCVMLCGHPQITDGTMLTAADRAGKTLKCSRCAKIDSTAARVAKNAARKAARHG